MTANPTSDASISNVLTVFPSVVELSPDCPTLTRVYTPDERSGVVLRLSSPCDLVEWFPSEPITDSFGAADIVVRGPLRKVEGGGPVIVKVEADGYEPSVFRVSGPPVGAVTLPATGELDDLVPLTPPLFPLPDENPLPTVPWPWPGEPPFDMDGDVDIDGDLGVDADDVREAHLGTDVNEAYDGSEPGDDPYGDGPAVHRNAADDDPYDGKEPPPELIAAAVCTGQFVNGVSGVPGAPDCGPLQATLRRTYVGRLNVVAFPGSAWTKGGGPALMANAVNSAVQFYADYCINLTPEMVSIDAAKARRMAAWYSGWIRRVYAAIGGADNLGRRTIPDDSGLLTDFTNSMRLLQRMVPRGRITIVFMDEYTDGSSVVSANSKTQLQIGINWVDRQSPRIVEHELVHALGKRRRNVIGPVTWNHRSACATAVSTIARTPQTLRQPVTDLGSYLDQTEFREIRRNRGARTIRRVR